MTTDDDLSQVREASRELPALDLDPQTAERIARAARRGPTPRRLVEAVLVALFVASFLTWAIYKVCEVLG